MTKSVNALANDRPATKLPLNGRSEAVGIIINRGGFDREAIMMLTKSFGRCLSNRATRYAFFLSVLQAKGVSEDGTKRVVFSKISRCFQKRNFDIFPARHQATSRVTLTGKLTNTTVLS